jgi:alanine racemase
VVQRAYEVVDAIPLLDHSENTVVRQNLPASSKGMGTGQSIEQAPDILPAQILKERQIGACAERPTWIEVDLSAIANNVCLIKSLVGTRVSVLACLKANAYGHGAVKVAHTMLRHGVDRLGVAMVSEAKELRDAGVNVPVHVLGDTPSWQMPEAVRLDLTVTLCALESARALSLIARTLGKTVKVHVKVDTGMGRLGIRAEHIGEVVALAREIAQLPSLDFEGLFTHFAMADTADKTHAYMQLAHFKRVLQALEAENLRPTLVHAANSAALLSMPETHFDLVRPGIALYGLYPSSEIRLPEGFRPALSFKTRVAYIKMVPAGESISYGCTFTTRRPTRVATLPVGYADGFRRGPYNWGTVLVHGQEAPILGHVCMDQCMIDVTHLPQTGVGDEVVLIGRQGSTTLTAEEVGRRLGTVSYEVIAELLARVPRVAHRDTK